MTDQSLLSAPGKVKPLDELLEILDSLRDDKKIVLCHGVFDLLHIGHIRHFEQARQMGDILVVTLTPDRYVNKGPQRPAFTERLRAESIAALSCVDYVAINTWPTAVDTIRLLKPHVYAKGSEYADPTLDVTGKIVDEKETVESVGGELAFTYDVVFSSSHLINRYLRPFSDEVAEYLSEFSKRSTVDEVVRYLRGARSLKVAVVGEAIIDEYHYCTAMEKSAKEPILAARYVSAETFAGGVLAVANHIAGFCDEVTVVTTLGEDRSREEFIRENLSPNVDPRFIYKKNSPTIVKRRYIEAYLLQKLFEMYEINDEELPEDQDAALCSELSNVVRDHDVIIVVDYGHGMLTRNAINLLCEQAPFLAVNTQDNAANRGFNTISRYPRADHVCLAAREIALEERDRRGDVEGMMLKVAQKVRYGHMIVTLGKEGSICYNEREGFIRVPAFTDHVVDRIGAGDAVISITSLCLAQNAPIEITGFVGNAVGAQAVGIIGNRTPIEPVSLFKYIESLLKWK